MTTARYETEPGPPGAHHHVDHRLGQDRRGGHGGHGGHGLMMMLMCIPMLLIAGFLLVTGAGGTGLILALVCLGMMAAMMFMMPGEHSHK